MTAVRWAAAIAVAATRRFIAIDGYDRSPGPCRQGVRGGGATAAGARGWAPIGTRWSTAWPSTAPARKPSDSWWPGRRTQATRPRSSGSSSRCSRSLQRTFEAAWDLPRSGLRGSGPGLLGAMVFIGEVVALVVLAEAVGPLAVNEASVALVRAVVGTLAWWPVQRVLVDGRVPWHDLLPGAVVAGVRQAAVMTLAPFVLRPVLIDQAQRFGAIGVAFGAGHGVDGVRRAARGRGGAGPGRRRSAQHGCASHCVNPGLVGGHTRHQLRQPDGGQRVACFSGRSRVGSTSSPTA